MVKQKNSSKQLAAVQEHMPIPAVVYVQKSNKKLNNQHNLTLTNTTQNQTN